MWTTSITVKSVMGHVPSENSSHAPRDDLIKPEIFCTVLIGLIDNLPEINKSRVMFLDPVIMLGITNESQTFLCINFSTRIRV